MLRWITHRYRTKWPLKLAAFLVAVPMVDWYKPFIRQTLPDAYRAYAYGLLAAFFLFLADFTVDSLFASHKRSEEK